jgi:hypothetical protein
MNSLNARDRDEFLKALEEARRAASDRDEIPSESRLRPESAHTASFELRRVIDDMAGRLRSYVSTRLLSRLYAENGAQTSTASIEQAPPPLPPRSEHETVLDELHLTPTLTAMDLGRLRREFAKLNHPDRVLPPGREQASRRMTIANSIIDEALRGKRTRTH